MSRVIVMAAAGIASFVALAAVHASPSDLYGFGTRSPGLAGAGVASSQDYEATYLNPAGLSGLTARRLTLGAVGGDLRLRFDGQDIGTERASGAIIGVELPIPLRGKWNDRVGLGLGFWIPTKTIARARSPQLGQPQFALLETRSHVVSLLVGLGVRLTPRVSVGIGMRALAALGGRIDVVALPSGEFTTQSQTRLLSHFSPTLGVQVEHSARWQWGVTFRGVSRSDYDIDIISDVGAALPLSLPQMQVAGVAQYDPMTLAAEAQWTPAFAHGRLAVIGQLSYQRWSAFPSPTDNATMGTPAQEPPGYHDIVVPTAALEYTSALGRGRLAARLGYSFWWSPAPEMTGQQSLLDNHRHVIATGLGWSWRAVHLNLWGQMHHLISRRHRKDPAQFEDGELPFTAISTSGQIFVAGMSLGVDL